MNKLLDNTVQFILTTRENNFKNYSLDSFKKDVFFDFFDYRKKFKEHNFGYTEEDFFLLFNPNDYQHDDDNFFELFHFFLTDVLIFNATEICTENKIDAFIENSEDKFLHCEDYFE